MSNGRRHQVVVLAYDQLCTFEFGCAVEVFGLERPELGVPWYAFEACAVEHGPIRASGGIEIVVRSGIEALDRADTIVIPGWRAVEVPPAALAERLRLAYQRGARLCSICSGVFLLAAAGVLAGKRVTTHWRYADELARRYPELRVEAHALYIDEGKILTSAGSAAGLDMMLHIVQRDHGARIANRVAQRLVIPPHRDGGQAQYIPRPVAPEGRGRIAKLMDWVRAHPAAPHSIGSLASKASMSRRTLQRQFRETVGLPPREWILRERIAIARELLESGTDSLQKVSERTGFGSPESFRRHFKRVVGASPAAYRRQFAPRPNGQGG